MSSSDKPTLALTLGDPAGIGPELIARLVSRDDLMGLARVVVIGDRWLWEAGQRVAGTAHRLAEAASFDLPPGDGPFFLPVDTVSPGEVSLPVATAAGGKSVLSVLRRCLGEASRGALDAICFGPLNKLGMKMAGLEAEDELHFFAHELGVRTFFCEFNTLSGLWTSRVTSHIPLKDVAQAIDKTRIKEAARIIHQAIVRSGVPKPRIAVAGLNPHAGEGGTCGTEEIDTIAPAVAESRSEGIPVDGPFPADTIFLKAKAGDYDAIVTMYHDQGQIALKLLGFNRGVTVHGGLPVVITTPAHGTAFDIAGKGRADPGATIEAYRMAVTMAANQRLEKAFFTK